MNYNTQPELYLNIRENLMVKGRGVFYAMETPHAPIGVFENEHFAEKCLLMAGFTKKISRLGYIFHPPSTPLEQPLREVLMP